VSSHFIGTRGQDPALAEPGHVPSERMCLADAAAGLVPHIADLRPGAAKEVAGVARLAHDGGTGLAVSAPSTRICSCCMAVRPRALS
jgi:hypothetical protein